MSQQVEISRKGKVQIIRMNRPDKKNALTRDMYQIMTEALATGDVDSDIHCHLMLGHRDVFTSGNDIADFMMAAQGGAGLGDQVLSFLRAIINVQKPLLAGVEGLAIGVGTTLLFHCDMAIAAPQARFKTPFLDLGLLPEAASTLIGPAAMGYKKAFALLAMGESLSGKEALEAGLVSELSGEDDLEQRALEMAERVASRPPEAMAITRKLMRGERKPLIDRMEEEAALFGERLKSKEAQEAFLAFMNRHK